MSLSVNRCNNNPLHLQSVGGRGKTEREGKKEKNDISAVLLVGLGLVDWVLSY